jgi:UDP-N-acetylmuramate: L-alanyl-gamma-D-glutamyl-meso-diaminopimelate ligase
MAKIHFIAIGGAAMHNLAIALHKKGYTITGSDDEIFEPSYSRLKNYSLLPKMQGWDPNRISTDLECVILGMHAKADNPELLQAKELGVQIYSYPEYLYEQTKDKKRVVIAGSHGKTTITAMIIHVLKSCEIDFDFMVGSQIDGFDTMVSLNKTSAIAVFEGDEYLSSPIDLRPKFFHYHPNIALISGIAWDHINVFPTFEIYKDQFLQLIQKIEKEGSLIYYSGDEVLYSMTEAAPKYIQKISYQGHPHLIRQGQTILIDDDRNEISIKVFGKHNLENISGARKVCNELGITDKQFYQSISQFAGTSKRLQVLSKTSDSIVFLDFAHSPSKVKATVGAVREQFPDKKLVALFELHTFSSLNKEFIPHYSGTLDGADQAVVYFNKEVLGHKGMPELTVAFIKAGFNNEGIEVISAKEPLLYFLKSLKLKNTVVLLMSSGNFAGIDMKGIFEKALDI